MTLTAHAITGAALASLTPNNPLMGFAVGFLSHFVLDAIPHWDYALLSRKEDENNPMNNDVVIGKDFVKDILRIALDGIIGLLFACFFYVFYLKYSLFVILCGVVGACLPDALQFVQMKWRHEPFTSLRRFHLWIHSRIRLDNKPVIGILSYIAVMSLVVWGISLI